MREDGPERLKRQRGTQPGLARALEALRKGADDNARLERVAARLGPLLDAPPPAAPSLVRGASSALLRRASFKLILGGLAVLVPAAWMLRGVGLDRTEVPVRPSESPLAAKLPDAALRDAALRDAGTAAPGESAYAAGARAHAPLAASDAVNTNTSRERAALPVRAGVQGRRRSARLRSGGGEALAERSQLTADAARGPSTAAKSEPEVQGAAAKQVDAHERDSSSKRAEEAQRNAEPEAAKLARVQASEEAQSNGPHDELRRNAAATPTQERAPAASTRQEPRGRAQVQRTASDARLSEAALLFEARKALANDAASSLRLLDEHARRYPKGVLVPEREVLAIEALRALGRTAEAEARLSRFEARYPDSLHLERLRR